MLKGLRCSKVKEPTRGREAHKLKKVVYSSPPPVERGVLRLAISLCLDSLRSGQDSCRREEEASRNFLPHCQSTKTSHHRSIERRWSPTAPPLHCLLILLRLTDSLLCRLTSEESRFDALQSTTTSNCFLPHRSSARMIRDLMAALNPATPSDH